MFRLNNKLAIRKLKNTYLIVTLDNVLHRIEDPVGVFILDLVTGSAGSTTADSVWQAVSGAFDVDNDPARYKSSVLSFLNDLSKKGIVAVEYESDGGHK